MILSSDAVRSRETVHEMSKSFSKAVPTEYLGSFYVTSSLDGHTRKLLEVWWCLMICTLVIDEDESADQREEGGGGAVDGDFKSRIAL